MVLMMRQPPNKVPIAIIKLQEIITQKGILNSCPDGSTEYNKTAIIPMVFCASFPPCPKLTQAEESN